MTDTVERVETRIVSIPIPRLPWVPLVDGSARLETVECVLLRLDSSAGVKGWSYTLCFGQSECELVVALFRHLAGCVVGTSLSHIPTALRRILSRMNMLGVKGLSIYGLSGYDVALHDVLCRSLGLNLADLLGRCRDSIPVYWGSCFFMGTPGDELEAQAAEVARRGFRAVKLRIGSGEWCKDLERVEMIADMLPAGVRVMVDATQQFTPIAAVKVARDLARLDPIWLEDPVAHYDYTGLEHVVRHSPVPIATGENDYLRYGLEQVMACGPEYVLADIQRVGGIREWQVVAGIASLRSTVLTPHGHDRVSTQLCAALDQSEVWLEYVDWIDPIMHGHLTITNGEVEVPDIIGNGLDISEDAVDGLATGPWVTAEP